LDFTDLGLLAFDAGDFALGFDDFAFGIALARPGAVARFAVFRPRLAIPVSCSRQKA